MHVGRVTEGLNPSWLNGYTMMMTGTEKASQYGYPLPWKDDEVIDLIKLSIFEGFQFFPGEGLLVLKAQARVMEFLVDCSRQILHEIPADKMISAAYPIQPKPILKTDIDESGHLSMAAMALEAPYTVPSELDFDRIASLLEAQTSAMEDHIWAMREDPAYFS
ncbi:uncharacterized protein FIESC28_04702 [Fusarium coffeatum]|uniref:Uncharacterized protein n=1 Tax=Fusarium coffeatum TaxID=231269 RepID=A0A366RXR6_9HYPO|nr:uncharacterized protein FIESC28_04702 [Fusarium coffeatum]RBR21859.1 hypothetical protein FIESC28_04702 [Fusarium coffeatum]